MLSRNRRRLLQFIAVPASVVVGLASTLVPASAATLVQLSTDPYTNKTSQHATEVEPDTYAFGSTIVSVFQVGRFFDGGASNIGFATSTDGGSSWTNGLFPSSTVFASPAGKYARGSDASVAYDPKHGVWMASWLGVVNPSGPVDVVVTRSTDGGLSWGAPVTVNATGHFDDKNWTVCDTTASSAFYGNCYTEFDDASLGDLEQMSTSTDGGLTWGAALPTRNKVHGIGGQPLVQPNGTVVVPFERFRGNNSSIGAFTSSDGGGSWGPAVTVAPIFFRPAAGGLRESPLPSAELDSSGKVYVVWTDCRFEPKCSASDLVLSTSTDGVNWTDPARIPADTVGSGVDHFIPGIAVDRSTSGNTTHIVLTYYYYPVAACTSSTCQLDVGYTSSTNGGATWSAGTQVAGPMSLGWLANTSQGTMVGDYISTSFSGAVAYPAFAVASAPSVGVFNETTDTVSGGVVASGGLLTASGQSSSQTSSGLGVGTRTSQ